MTKIKALRTAFCMTMIFVIVVLGFNFIGAVLAGIGITGLAASAIQYFCFLSFLLLDGVSTVWRTAGKFFDWAMQSIVSLKKGMTNAA